MTSVLQAIPGKAQIAEAGWRDDLQRLGFALKPKRAEDDDALARGLRALLHLPAGERPWALQRVLHHLAACDAQLMFDGPRLPLRWRWYGGKLRLLAIAGGHIGLKGLELETISGVGVDVLAELPRGLESLRQLPWLRALGLTDAEGRCALRLRDAEGRRQDLMLSTSERHCPWTLETPPPLVPFASAVGMRADEAPSAELVLAAALGMAGGLQSRALVLDFRERWAPLSRHLDERWLEALRVRMLTRLRCQPRLRVAVLVASDAGIRATSLAAFARQHLGAILIGETTSLPPERYIELPYSGLRVGLRAASLQPDWPVSALPQGEDEDPVFTAAAHWAGP